MLAFGYLRPEVFEKRYDAAVAAAANEQSAAAYNELVAKLRTSDEASRAKLLAASTPVAGALTQEKWQPFTLDKLAKAAVEQGRTVMVDFSADWCANCKVFEKTVLHTEPVEQAIEKAGIVTMYGDYTHKPPVLKETLNALGANGVPVIALFPGDDPYHPIVFRGGYTKSGLLEAIEQATGQTHQRHG